MLGVGVLTGMLVSTGNTSVEALKEHPLTIRMTDTQADMAPCCEVRGKFWMFTTDISFEC